MEFSFLPSKVHKKNFLVLYVNRMKSRTIDSHQVTRWLCLILPMGDSWPEREVSHPASHSLWAVEPGPQMQVPSCPHWVTSSRTFPWLWHAALWVAWSGWPYSILCLNSPIPSLWAYNSWQRKREPGVTHVGCFGFLGPTKDYYYLITANGNYKGR